MGYLELRERSALANRALHAAELVILSFGNASALDRQHGVLAIKASGVPADRSTADDIVVVAVEDGRVVEGRPRRPSSDTPTHLVLYRAFPAIGGVVHTHSPAATAWAQAGRAIPCLGTTHADHFKGEIPVTRALSEGEVGADYETATGNVIVERFADKRTDPTDVPGVLVASHGVFTWGPDVESAVENAIALEAVALMALHTVALDGKVPAIPRYLMERHHARKHGPNAYYGQVGIGPAVGDDPET
jgi:L-ribulose-5-phosphate 4-epimerase